MSRRDDPRELVKKGLLDRCREVEGVCDDVAQDPEGQARIQHARQVRVEVVV